MAGPILVIDVSHHQGGSIGKVDGLPRSHWDALKECGVQAAVIKASQGTRHIDEDAAIHVGRARAAGMEVGLYHFADGSSGTAQADHFIAAARRANGGTLEDVLLVIDVEANPDPAGSDVKGPQVRAMARRLAAKAPRNTVLLYTSEGYWRAIGNPDMAAEVDGLWQARWDGAKHRCKAPDLPEHPPRAGFGGWAGRPPLWQFGRLRYGVGRTRHGIDGNAWYGSLVQLRDLFRTSSPSKPAREPPVESDRPTYVEAYNGRLRVLEQAVRGLTPATAAGGKEATEDVLALLRTLHIGVAA